MNSFLNETVISFFPTECACAFVGEPWFFSNHQVQLDVLRLCEAGYAHLIETFCDENVFAHHVMMLVGQMIDPRRIYQSLIYDYDFVEELVQGIEYGEYLLTRGWFCRSIYRHVNVLLLRIHGYLHWIDPVAGDFDEHIESIIQQIQQNERMEREEFWFYRQPMRTGGAPQTVVNWRMDNGDDNDDDVNDDNDDDDDDDDNYGDDNDDDDYGDDNDDNDDNDDYGDDDDDDNDRYHDGNYYEDHYYDEQFDNADDNDDYGDDDDDDNAEQVERVIVAYVINENGEYVALDEAALEQFFQTNNEEVQIVVVNADADIDADADDDADADADAEANQVEVQLYEDMVHHMNETWRLRDEVQEEHYILLEEQAEAQHALAEIMLRIQNSRNMLNSLNLILQ